MNARTRSRRRALVLAVALAAAGALLVLPAIASTPPPPTRTPATAGAAPGTLAPAAGAAPVDAGFDYADPQQVCRRFAAALYSADTTRDRSPRDAWARAARYASAALATMDTGRDGRWDTWTAHRARLQTRVSAFTDVHQDPDTTLTAQRAVRLAATAVGVQQWRGWTEHTLLYCALTREPAERRWRVSAYDIYPVPAP